MRKNRKGEYIGCGISAIGALVLMLLLLCSCSSKRIVMTATVTVHDTISYYQLERDSVYVHDSIFQAVEYKGDTLLMYKYKYKTEYRDRVKHDSIYFHLVDTVYKDRIVEVEKKHSILTDLWEICRRIAYMVALALVASFAWKWYKCK